MNKLNILLVSVLVGVLSVNAAQDIVLDGMREVRDPVQLKAWLEANASDAETRVAAVESSTAAVGSTLTASNGVFNIVSGTQLVFIVGGVTNVLDSDITSE